jgi:hypothetical protein
VSGVGTLWAKKKPAGVNLRGAAGVIGLSTVARQCGQDKKQSKQQTQGEIPKDTE